MEKNSNTINTVARSFQYFWLRTVLLLIILTGGSPVIQKATAQITPILAQSSMQGTNISDDAEGKFLNLFKRIQGFAWIIILIGLVVAAMMMITGKTQLAIMVAVAAVVLGGGIYIIGLIQKSLS